MLDDRVVAVAGMVASCISTSSESKEALLVRGTSFVHGAAVLRAGLGGSTGDCTGIAKFSVSCGIPWADA